MNGINALNELMQLVRFFAAKNRCDIKTQQPSAYFRVDSDPVEISGQLFGDVRLASRRKSNESNHVRRRCRRRLLAHAAFAHRHGQVEAEFAMLESIRRYLTNEHLN